MTHRNFYEGKNGEISETKPARLTGLIGRGSEPLMLPVRVPNGIWDVMGSSPVTESALRLSHAFRATNNLTFHLHQLMIAVSSEYRT